MNSQNFKFSSQVFRLFNEEKKNREKIRLMPHFVCYWPQTWFYRATLTGRVGVTFDELTSKAWRNIEENFTCTVYVYIDPCQDHDNASFIHVPLVYPSVYPLLNLWISDLPKANKRNTDWIRQENSINVIIMTLRTWNTCNIHQSDFKLKILAHWMLLVCHTRTQQHFIFQKPTHDQNFNIPWQTGLLLLM